MTNVWQQLVRRLKYLREFVRTKTAQGFNFEGLSDFKLDRELKESPRATRKALKEARKWSADELYKHATYKGIYSDYEEIPATEYRARKRQWEKEHKDYDPDLSLLDWLKDEIEALPAIRFFRNGIQLEIAPHKNLFKSMLDEILINLESKKQEDEVKYYFESKNAELSAAFTIVTEDSDLESVRTALGRAYSIIAGRPLTPEESEDLDVYSQTYEDVNEESMSEKMLSKASYLRGLNWTNIRF